MNPVVILLGLTLPGLMWGIHGMLIDAPFRVSPL